MALDTAKILGNLRLDRSARGARSSIVVILPSSFHYSSFGRPPFTIWPKRTIHILLSRRQALTIRLQDNPSLPVPPTIDFSPPWRPLEITIHIGLPKHLLHRRLSPDLYEPHVTSAGTQRYSEDRFPRSNKQFCII
jgi:hypothetical protein